MLVSDPQENVGKLKELLRLCAGDEVEDLVQGTIRKLAIASLTEVFISIIPGYQIRTLTEEEQKQKMRLTQGRFFSLNTLCSPIIRNICLVEENAMKLVKDTQAGKTIWFSQQNWLSSVFAAFANAE
uniref:Nucleolar complex-associated protein 3 N-terminal domain-containing protein n=1 Tax=Ditylenchus dipsaci TaxID=166011 RepID=A0A915DQ84_9BILA